MNLLGHWQRTAQSWTRIKALCPDFSICSLQIGSNYRSKKQLRRMLQFLSVNVCICTQYTPYKTKGFGCGNEQDEKSIELT